MRPVIGIVPLYDEEKDSYWMLPGYMKALEECLSIPVMLPLTEDKTELLYFIRTCDGLLLPGGQDVDPASYGEERLPACGPICPAKDRMEGILLDAAVRLDKPVLGICRGLQFLNAHTGGTLYQDLPTEHPGLCHRMERPYDRGAHPVTVERKSPLYEIVGSTEYSVNSCHHQGIRDLSPLLCAAATAPDGLVEAAWMPGKHFILGVQWHPEWLYQKDPTAMRLFEAFVKAAKYL